MLSFVIGFIRDYWGLVLALPAWWFFTPPLWDYLCPNDPPTVDTEDAKRP